MNCFQIVKTVLDEIYSEIPGENDSIRDVNICNALTYLRSRYAKLLTDSTPINYSDPVNRFAYVYSYVTCHANLVAQRINTETDFQTLFDKPKVNISCVGGGPGSDFLGILKYMMQFRKTADVKCYLLDREERWGESWSDVDRKVDSNFRMSTHFQPFDVTATDSWQRIQKYARQSDLFTLTYFMSEIHAVKAKSVLFFNELFRNANPNALFLYIDNDNPNFYGWFDDLIRDHNITVISSGCLDTRMPFDEQTVDLGDYYQRFGDPKLKAKIAYRLCKKCHKEDIPF